MILRLAKANRLINSYRILIKDLNNEANKNDQLMSNLEVENKTLKRKLSEAKEESKILRNKITVLEKKGRDKKC